jgi:uncharacterized cupin superfamily protein
MSQQRRHPNVVNQDELDVQEVKQGRHHAIGRRFGPAAGNAQLGAQLMELPPGKISFPFHFHCATEESIYVVSGKGTARIGGARVPIRAGDWIAYPVGPDHAHQMINDSDAPLVYLTVSNRVAADVVGYPDSKKVAMAAGPSFDKPWVRQICREGESLGYWDGEPEAK